MKLRQWYAVRGPGYVGRRAAILWDRYGLTPSKAASRIESLINNLAEYDCAPTLPTPARVVERYPKVIRHLQSKGAEIGVHGYDHVDLGAYPPAEAEEQLRKATEIFSQHGIEAHGFRCPYLSCTDDLLDALPQGMFEYSSNRGIWWDVVSPSDAGSVAPLFDVPQAFYKAKSALEAVCVPCTQSNMVEIPVCVPDDLQLHDGLQLGTEGMTEAWSQILHRTHQRGELFTLLFHPELASRCEQSLVAVLGEAERLHPSVWIARLRDIGSWWQEKSSFGVAISHSAETMRLSFVCSERATILVSGLDAGGSERAWDESYYQLSTRELDIPAEPRPFVGLPADTPEQTVSFLQEQGYIVDSGEAATSCGTYLDAATLARVTTEVELISHIEASSGPLIRYWRWPDGAKSAMCVTGDLDALSLLDYALRLLT